LFRKYFNLGDSDENFSDYFFGIAVYRSQRVDPAQNREKTENSQIGKTAALRRQRRLRLVNRRGA
jgi:hypothetical protein